MTLSTQVLIGLGLGIFTGIFVGEMAAPLDVVGTGFVRLLQMTVLPYMTLSLVGGIGRLTPAQAFSMARRAGAILVILWVIALVLVPLMPLAFPDWESASFFSASLVQDESSVNFVELYIPANPFHALSASVVPAVVLFSIAMGVALIGVEKKDTLLDVLDSLLATVAAVTNGVIRLAPYGVFAIAASSAGTMDVSELGRLQVFLTAHIALSLLLAFWVLPVLIASLTRLTYRQVLGHTRDALVTGFATGNMMVVLPLIAERTKELFRAGGINNPDADGAAEIIVPASFNFPTQGTLLSLGFVLFAGWSTGSPFTLTQYPNLLVSGLMSFFGGVYVGIPFLLDMFRIPADVFRLFVTVDVITGRFGTLVSAMQTVTLAVLGGAAMCGQLSIRRGRLLIHAVVTVLLTLVLLGGIRLLFTQAIDGGYKGDQVFVEMDLSLPSVPSKVLTSLPAPLPHTPGSSRLGEIEARGFLRVGYLRDALPWAFINDAGRLVGFDIEMAHQLANDLGVSIEFVRLERGKADRALREGRVDLLMSGISVTPDRARHAAFSRPYLDTTLAFVVKDYDRERFSKRSEIHARRHSLKIAVPSFGFFENRLRTRLPGADVTVLDSPREFFRAEAGTYDAMLYSAEAGSAWTLMYPSFSLVVPLPNPVKLANAYPVAGGDAELLAYLNAWIAIQQSTGGIDRLFSQWMEGDAGQQRGPRWSIIRDVLGWVD